MNVLILGRKWRVTTMAPDSFIKRFKDEYAGITLPQTREVVINTDELNLSTVVHEITHAFISSLCNGSANLTEDQHEEVYCELVAHHGENILTLSKALTKSLRRR